MDLEAMNNTGDIFDSVVFLHQRAFDEGFEDGFKDGFVSGKHDGWETGLKLGFQTGEELGFYQGCVDVWRSALRVDPVAFSPHVRRRIGKLRELLEKYPLLEPENEDVQVQMDAIRVEFKVVSLSLGLGLPYEGYHKASSSGHEVEYF